MWMAWGKDLTFFCNDAYLPTLGVKQAWALGTTARKVWEEIWPDIGPRIDRVLSTGEATWDVEMIDLTIRRGSDVHKDSPDLLLSDPPSLHGITGARR